MTKIDYKPMAEEHGPAALVRNVAEQVSRRPSPQPHLRSIRGYFDAGYDHLMLMQIGPEQDAFFEVFERELRPVLAS